IETSTAWALSCIECTRTAWAGNSVHNGRNTWSSPTERDSNQQSSPAYSAYRSKNYWSEGQFWSRSFFLHKSFDGLNPAKCAVLFPHNGLSPRLFCRLAPFFSTLPAVAPSQ